VLRAGRNGSDRAERAKARPPVRSAGKTGAARTPDRKVEGHVIRIHGRKKTRSCGAGFLCRLLLTKLLAVRTNRQVCVLEAPPAVDGSGRRLTEILQENQILQV